MKKRCILTFALVALALGRAPAHADDVNVTATITPQVVPVGNDVILIVRVEGKFRRSSSPELPALEDFYVYESGTSQNFSLVNGQMSSSVIFNYTLTARKEGTYTIEPITFTMNDKQYTANPVTVEVTPAATGVVPAPPATGGATDTEPSESGEDRSIFIDASIDRDTVYVNQQVTWTLGYYADGRVSLLRSPNYTPPAAEGFWVEDLPPQNKYYRVLSGRQYMVNEIKRGYFPTSPGKYTIGDARVDVVLDDVGRRSNMDDLFRRGFRSAFGKQHTMLTDPQEILVLPLPSRGKPTGFSGIVAENLTVSTAADKQVVQVGEPVNVTVEVNGRGNMKTISPPRVPELPKYKLYESGSSSDTFKRDYVVTGRRKYDYVVVPQVEGKWEIPSIEVSYFDPVRKQYLMARSHAVPLDVKPGTQEEGRKVVYAGGGDDFEVINRDIRFIHPVPSTLSIGAPALHRSSVYMAMHALPMLAIIVSLVVERRRRQLRDNAGYARASRAFRQADKKINEGLKHSRTGQVEAGVGLVSQGVYGFIADKMNASAAGLTSETVVSFLHGQCVRDEVIGALQDVMSTCDAARYAAGAVSPQQVEETAVRARDVLKTLEKDYLS